MKAPKARFLPCNEHGGLTLLNSHYLPKPYSAQDSDQTSKRAFPHNVKCCRYTVSHSALKAGAEIFWFPTITMGVESSFSF